ncbi:MAG: potassium-transporting ATPase subunit KdpA [Synechococcales cyanobacterium]
MLEGLIQIGITIALMVIIVPFFGGYMARVYLQEKTWLDPVFLPLERGLFRFCGVFPDQSLSGWGYVRAVLVSNLWMGITVFLLIIFQEYLPLNPTGLGMTTWHLGLHTAISFLTNTNQQHYCGENTFSYASQMLGLGFLFFTSAATGLAVAMAFVRGLTGRPLGNFYVDVTLSITRILLPIAVVGATVLMVAGIPETLNGPAVVTTLEGSRQAIALGPVAHFEIMKELGENGGGFFCINSAHPLENPNPLTNLIETLILLLIPTSLIYTYGIFANNKKQAWLLFGMVFVFYGILVGITAVGEYQGNPLVNALIGDQPNLEGKEVRFGWAQSALFAVSTTGTMTGAVNAMHDSLMPPGGFATLFNLFLQMIWGGQGTGTAFLIIYVILTVFLTGLMVGRTPEFWGRKIEKPEIVLASIILLVHPLVILIPSAITLSFPETLAGISNPGFHGLAQVVYEYASAAANNGSGFEGLGDNTLWWNLSCSVVLLAGRYLPIVALLLLADSMTRKQPVPATPGTLRTDTVLFTSVTAITILLLGFLTFLPVLVLGPIAEAFNLVA